MSRLDHMFQDLEIHRAFTVFQFMAILEEFRNTLTSIEHDLCSTRTSWGMIELASRDVWDAAKEAAVLLYSPEADTFLEDMTRNADRVFYFDECKELRLG